VTCVGSTPACWTPSTTPTGSRSRGRCPGLLLVVDDIHEADDASLRLLHLLLATVRRDVAEQLAGLGAPPSRVAHRYLTAGLPSRAVPYVLRTVESAGALGAYRDALTLVDAVREHAGPADLPGLLARRGDLLMALGGPEALSAYQEAIGVTTGTEHRLVRARLAARRRTPATWTPRAQPWPASARKDAADAPILLAQGLISHQRGDWFERFRLELRRTQGKQRMAAALFDAHLCVAEYMLYGRVSYADVIADGEELRRPAAQTGALRRVAFATALIGEAALCPVTSSGPSGSCWTRWTCT